MSRRERRNLMLAASGCVFMLCYIFLFKPDNTNPSISSFRVQTGGQHTVKSKWSRRQENNPVRSFTALPSGTPHKFPMIQVKSVSETAEQKTIRKSRQAAVRQSFQHTWRGYREHAWLADELRPVTGGKKNTMGGWAATLVDSLDSLWIMGFQTEFDEAVEAVSKIDFESTESGTISVFETTIRCLGGLLGGYELSGQTVLLDKALQLGYLLYAAFDTPSRMPNPKFDVQAAHDGKSQDLPDQVVTADIASLSLEFTRLTQLSGDPRFYDAVQRVTDLLAEQQQRTEIPGIWPMFVNARDKNFTVDHRYTFGGMVDSVIEYLMKMDIMLGGQKPEYRSMYELAVSAGKKALFYRPMTLDNEDILISSMATVYGGNNVTNDGMGQHLACFLGGMFSTSSKVYERPEDLETARRLTDGCYWTYNSMGSGIMPEFFVGVPCADATNCPWDENTWHAALRSQHSMPANTDVRQLIINRHIPPGFASILDGRYVLRPEAIESMFYMYRVTGDSIWQDKAWKLFLAIEKAAKTTYGYSAIQDVAAPVLKQMDEMESFWTSETLKYLYLLFSDVDTLSLDEWVLTTEAHPFKRPDAEKKKWW